MIWSALDCWGHSFWPSVASWLILPANCPHLGCGWCTGLFLSWQNSLFHPNGWCTPLLSHFLDELWLEVPPVKLSNIVETTKSFKVQNVDQEPEFLQYQSPLHWQPVRLASVVMIFQEIRGTYFPNSRSVFLSQQARDNLIFVFWQISV